MPVAAYELIEPKSTFEIRLANNPDMTPGLPATHTLLEAFAYYL
jgi:hypothetical protein